jgi:hypothetical protein
MINSSNYKIYLIDYSNGLLTQALADELLHFINRHPDIKAEFELIKSNIQQPDSIFTKPAFNKLKKPTYQELKAHLQNLLIDELEHQITADNKLELELALRNYAALQTDKKLFANTILTEDLTATFPNKGKLKKRLKAAQKRNLWLYYTSGIAAAFLIFSLLFLFKPTDTSNYATVVIKENSTATINQAPLITKKVEPFFAFKAYQKAQYQKSIQILAQTQTYNLNKIEAKSVKILPVAANFLKVNKLPVHAMVVKENMLSNIAVANKPYQTIDEMLIEKITNKSIRINKDTSLLANVVGAAEKLTQENKHFSLRPINDENGNRKGILLVTPFFNIEKIYAAR